MMPTLVSCLRMGTLLRHYKPPLSSALDSERQTVSRSIFGRGRELVISSLAPMPAREDVCVRGNAAAPWPWAESELRFKQSV